MQTKRNPKRFLRKFRKKSTIFVSDNEVGPLLTKGWLTAIHRGASEDPPFPTHQTEQVDAWDSQFAAHIRNKMGPPRVSFL
jgi:hypothetical protein